MIQFGDNSVSNSEWDLSKPRDIRAFRKAMYDVRQDKIAEMSKRILEKRPRHIECEKSVITRDEEHRILLQMQIETQREIDKAREIIAQNGPSGINKAQSIIV